MKETLAHLPGQILLALATNDSAQPEYRIAAVELLIENKFPQADRAEIAHLVTEARLRKVVKEEIVDAIEGAVEAPVLSSLSASVTTKSLDGEKEDIPEPKSPVNGQVSLPVGAKKSKINSEETPREHKHD